jgi:hypothetical protein
MAGVSCRRRRRTRLSLLIALSLGALTIVSSAAQPAASRSQQQQCFGTLILERVTVLNDTDPNSAWSRVDQWTYHIYSWQNGVLASAQNYKFAGDTGYSRDSNTSGDGDNIVANALAVGNLGETVTLKLELWTKEKDPRTNARGAFPADQRGNANPFLLQPPRSRTCEPGDDRFSVVVDIPRNTQNPELAETDGTFEFHWLWRLSS